MKISQIIISQPEQASGNPHYTELAKKYGVRIDFKPFFNINPLDMNDFRKQRIDVSSFTAIVFSAKATIDAFFKICKELRYKVPESLKYFCTSEAIAYYLQKHIVYRKRKIFFGNGSFESVVKNALNEKHRGETFLITNPDHINYTWDQMFTDANLSHSSAVFAKVENNNLKDVDLSKYQAIAFYSPLDVASLFANFPKFKQGNTMFTIFGEGAKKAMVKAGLHVAVSGPSEQNPSMASAIESCIVNCDKLIEEQAKAAMKKPVGKKIAAAKRPAAKPVAKKPVAKKPAAKKSAPAKRKK